MPTPPITRKPIPKTMQHWYNEVRGIWGFLDTVGDMADANGQKWVDSQRAYLNKRLADLIDNPPFKCKIPRYLLHWRESVEL